MLLRTSSRFFKRQYGGGESARLSIRVMADRTGFRAAALTALQDFILDSLLPIGIGLFSGYERFLT